MRTRTRMRMYIVRIVLLCVLLAGLIHGQNPEPVIPVGSGSGGGSGGSGTVSGTTGAIAAFTSSTAVGDATTGTGISIAGGVISTDSATVPQYSTGAGTPSANCTAGRDIYLDTTAKVAYTCSATNTWKRTSGDVYACADTGGDDTYAPTVVGFPAAYATGQTLICRFTTGNTSAATINVNGIGAKAIKQTDGSTDPVTNAILAANIIVLVYDSAANSSAGAWILRSNSAANISGVIPIANLATGTPDGTKFIRDDGTLQTPSGGTGTTHQIFMNLTGNTVSSTTTYASPIAVTFAAENTRSVMVSRDTTFTKLYVRTLGTQGACDAVVTLRNTSTATDTAITLTIPNGATTNTFSDTAHTASFTAGQRFVIKVASTTCLSAVMGEFTLEYN